MYAIFLIGKKSESGISGCPTCSEELFLVGHSSVLQTGKAGTIAGSRGWGGGVLYCLYVSFSFQ